MIPDPLLARLVALERRIQALETGEALPIVARYTTNTGSVGSGSATRIDYATQVYDPWAAVTTGGSWVFTAPIGGYYLVKAAILFDGSTAYDLGEIMYIRLSKGGTTWATMGYKNYIDSGGTTLYVQLEGTTGIQLAKDDTCYVEVFQQTGSTLNLFASHLYNFIDIIRVG